jgi:hypothetical protein
VTTHEPEITTPVMLATGNGRRLDPAARGWSRHPLQTANQRGNPGRKKRWDYWSIQAEDLLLSGVVAHLDFFGTSDVWWLDMSTFAQGGRGCGSPGGKGFELPDVPGSVPLTIEARNYRFTMRDDDAGNTFLSAHWVEKSGERAELSAVIEMPPGHETLNVVIPWSNTLFQFTSKHQARPARGELQVGDRTWTFGGDDAAAEAWGVIDIGRGRWPYRTVWNWGGGAGRAADGTVVGLQFGGKWTVGTGFTENGVFVNGRLSKIGRELDWAYDWDDPMQPWRVRDPGGQIDVVLTPRYDKYGLIDAKLMRRETHQVFGTWDGYVVDDDGDRHDLSGLQGFAEESRARW